MYTKQFDLYYMLKFIQILFEYEIEKGRELSMKLQVRSQISLLSILFNILGGVLYTTMFGGGGVWLR